MRGGVPADALQRRFIEWRIPCQTRPGNGVAVSNGNNVQRLIDEWQTPQARSNDAFRVCRGYPLPVFNRNVENASHFTPAFPAMQHECAVARAQGGDRAGRTCVRESRHVDDVMPRPHQT